MDNSQEPNVDEPRPETPDEQIAASTDEDQPVGSSPSDPDEKPEPIAEAAEEAEEPEAEEAEEPEAEEAEEPEAEEAEEPEAEEAEEPEAEEAEEPEAEEAEDESEPEEPAATAEPGSDEPLEAEPELIAAVEEAFEDVDVEAETSAAEGEETAAPIDEWQPGDWFVVHTYAGYENKVKANLETRIVSMNMEEKIFEVVIPMEDVMEMKGGKKQMVQRKVFPGYLLVRMDLDDDSWYVVRNTPGVTGFVGSGSKPIPLSTIEVDRILQRGAAAEEERPRPKPEWQVNDPVRVTTGPFANFQGVVSEVDLDRSKLKVLVNIFGRETPVELGFDQVAKV